METDLSRTSIGAALRVRLVTCPAMSGRCSLRHRPARTGQAVLVQHRRDDGRSDINLDLSHASFVLSAHGLQRIRDTFSVWLLAGWVAEGGLLLSEAGRVEITRVPAACAGAVVDDVATLLYTPGMTEAL